MNIGTNADDNKDEIIINGTRYVPEETNKYVEATVHGKLHLAFSSGPLGMEAESLVLTDVDASRAYSYGYWFPPGTRVRIYVVNAPKEPA